MAKLKRKISENNVILRVLTGWRHPVFVCGAWGRGRNLAIGGEFSLKCRKSLNYILDVCIKKYIYIDM